MMKLDSLSIEYLRGATCPITIPFDSSKKMTMIFGENGAGKSTIVEALERTLGRAGASPNVVEATTCNGRSVKASLSSSVGKFSYLHPGQRTLPAGIENPSMRVLRRSDILTLIEAPPSKRYEALSSYIELQSIFKCEETLRQCTREIKRDFDRTTSEYSNTMAQLEKLWEAEGSLGATYEEWAAAESQKDVSELNKEKNEVEPILEALKELGRLESGNTTLSEGLKIQMKALIEAKEKLKEAEERNANPSSLISLLDLATNYIEEHRELKECPVCEQSVDKEDLLTALKHRSRNLEELTAATKLHNQTKKAVESSQSQLKSLIRSYYSKYNELVASIGQLSAKSIKDAIAQSARNQKFTPVEIDTASTINIESTSTLRSLTAKLDNLHSELTKSLNHHNSVNAHYNRLQTNRNDALKLEGMKKQAEEMLVTYETIRKNFIDEELTSINQEVNELYEKLHPGEKLGNIKLALNPRFQTSLNLSSNFHDLNNVNPQSYYSESHLDTLGLVVFLALAKKYRLETSIVVLDDVVTSVDEAHLDRLISVLHDQTDFFSHIFLTTHYRPWRDRYRHHRAPGSELYFIELRNWTLENGIRLNSIQNLMPELKEKLSNNNFNRQEICSLAGVCLENVLDCLTLQYGCHLPRKRDNSYGLRELLSGLQNRRLFPLLRIERYSERDGSCTLKLNLKAILENIGKLAAVRSQVGCHYNFDGSLVSDKDVTEFGNTVLEFMEHMTCGKGGDFPNRDKSGEYWETKSKLVRLYPLRIPTN